MDKYKCKTCGAEFTEYSHDYRCGVCGGAGCNNDEECFQCGGDGDLKTKHTDYCRPCLMEWFEEEAEKPKWTDNKL